MATRLTRHYGVVALKLGGAGCVLAMPGQTPVRVPAHPARARDTTGAGDAFCAAFMSRWLAGGTRAGAPDPQATDPPAADPQAADPQVADPQIADPQIADLTSAAEFAVTVAASVVTRFGARPTAPH
jgi:sugar/nucleoside kinase (ribokinase family)